MGLWRLIDRKSRQYSRGPRHRGRRRLSVILIDANLLIYASVKSSQHQERAKQWLEDRINGTVIVGLPWASLFAFLRIVTSPRIYRQPIPVAGAWQQVESWLDCSVVRVPLPTDRHREVVGELILATGAVGN